MCNVINRSLGILEYIILPINMLVGNYPYHPTSIWSQHSTNGVHDNVSSILVKNTRFLWIPILITVPAISIGYVVHSDLVPVSSGDGSANVSDLSPASTCGTFWTPYISWSESHFDETSFNSISSCRNLAICVTGNNGGLSGSLIWSIYEVSSGSSTLKEGGYISQPWSGCHGVHVNDLATGSRVRLVVDNDGFESVWQIDAY